MIFVLFSLDLCVCVFCLRFQSVYNCWQIYVHFFSFEFFKFWKPFSTSFQLFDSLFFNLCVCVCMCLKFSVVYFLCVRIFFSSFYMSIMMNKLLIKIMEKTIIFKTSYKSLVIPFHCCLVAGLSAFAHV